MRLVYVRICDSSGLERLHFLCQIFFFNRGGALPELFAFDQALIELVDFVLILRVNQFERLMLQAR